MKTCIVCGIEPHGKVYMSQDGNIICKSCIKDEDKEKFNNIVYKYGKREYKYVNQAITRKSHEVLKKLSKIMGVKICRIIEYLNERGFFNNITSRN